MTTIEAGDNVVVMSGDHIRSREQFNSMLNSIIPHGMVIAALGDGASGETLRAKATPQLTEIELWNASVDARKAEKKGHAS